MHKAQLTITVTLDSMAKPLSPDFAIALEREIRNWNDGRYGFYTEMFARGLQECLTAAARDLVQTEMKQQPDAYDMVDDGSGKTVKWFVESQKIKPNTPYLDLDNLTVSLTPKGE